MGCEHVPTPIVEVGVLLLMPTDSWEMAVPVKWLKSGCIFLQLNGLILDADGAVGVDPFNIAQWGTSPPT